ncbi:MAG: TonB-dependent receptor plug domain-containing protein, partial [Acidobacteriia bacterium]|nr:TonB-dependent receptor plug domain-containing protein [Terriglobia bacterium]
MKSRFHLACSTPALLAGLLAAVLTPVALLAGSITGHVLDPDGLAVSNARIRLFARNSGELRKTISRGDGSYSIQGVPDGQYLVEASTEDAALSSQQPIRVEGAQTVDLEMEISGTEVEVVVTASSTPLTLQEVAKALDVVDSEQIALRNEFALSEAIRNVPGVRVQQLRGPGSFTTVQTRGLRNHDTAVLIDGLRFRDAAGTQGDATAFYQNMNIVDTERVEFLRGSGSSLYGSHAIGGVMNISSSQGGGRPHGELRAEGGGLGMMRGVGRIGGGLAEDRFVYSSGFSHLNVVNGYRGGSPYRNNSAQGFAKYSFAPKVSLSGRVWGADAFLGLTESPAFPDSVVANFPASGNVPARPLPNSELSRFEQGMPFNAGSATFVPAQIDPDNRRVSSFLATALIFQQQLTPDSSYRLSYQNVDTNRSFQDGPAGPGQFDPVFSNNSQFDGQTHTFQARTDHRLGAYNQVTLGYEYEDEKYFNFNTDESPSPADSTIDIDQASHALFAQDQIRLLQGTLNVSLSGRAQFFDLGSPRFSGTQSPYDDKGVDTPPSAYTGDASVAYFVRGSQTKLRGHAGNSFRAPSLFERFGGSFSSFSGGFNYWGDPRLNPERAIAVDGGIDQWLFGSQWRLSGTFFYTNLQETVIFDFANFPAIDI